MSQYTLSGWKPLNKVYTPPIIEHSLVLIRCSTNERIQVTSAEFIIGKSKIADYTIEGNPLISRQHAKITKKAGRYYLEDMGSLNNTLINGNKVVDAVLLEDGQIIELVNEQFKVCIEKDRRTATTVPVNEEMEEELKELYMELGKAYYEGAFEDPLPQLLPLFDQITELLTVEEETAGKCSECGAELDDDARFCEVCGTPVTKTEIIEGVFEPEKNICVNCGNQLSETARFCGMCGTRV